MQLKDYFILIKNLEALDKEYKLNLSEHLVITIIQEYCKDLRTNQIGEQRSNKTVPQIELATEKQKSLLKKLKIPVNDKLTKQEAFKLIQENL